MRSERQQAHCEEWVNNPTSEAARSAYVASSRPRRILIWVVKNLKKCMIRSDVSRRRNPPGNEGPRPLGRLPSADLPGPD